jgi:hypothetical protein
VSCLDLLQRLRHTVPLLNTLHVLGLQMTLWSLIQFAQCGHTIIFGDTTIRIIMHEGRPESFELRLSHPFYQPRDHPFGYCIKCQHMPTVGPPLAQSMLHQHPSRNLKRGPSSLVPRENLKRGRDRAHR